MDWFMEKHSSSRFILFVCGRGSSSVLSGKEGVRTTYGELKADPELDSGSALIKLN